MKKQGVVVMDDNLTADCRTKEEKDILDILMDSALYPELSPDEKNLLLNRVMGCYRANPGPDED
jgi:hypothetical protein